MSAEQIIDDTKHLILENDLLRATVSASYGGYVSDLFSKLENANVLEKFDNNTESTWASSVMTESEFMKTDAATMERIETVSIQQVGGKVTVNSIYGKLQLEKTFSIDPRTASLRIEEAVTNLDTKDCEVSWSNCLTLDENFLGSGFRIETPATSYFDPHDDPILRMRWPVSADGSDLSTSDWGDNRYYLTDFSEGQCRVTAPAKGLSFELRWNAAKFPYCIMRKSHGVLLQPSVGLPGGFEEGYGLLTIPAGGSETAWFEVRVL